MAPVIYKRTFRWNIEGFTRENIREKSNFSDILARIMQEHGLILYARYNSHEFSYWIEGLEIEMNCYLSVPNDGYCRFAIGLASAVEYYSDVLDFKSTIDVSIQQSNGVVKKIESVDNFKYPDIAEVADPENYNGSWFKSGHFLKIDDIFNPENKYLDSDNTLTFIIDITTSHKDYDGSLKSLCGLQLVDLITTENVIELLYYADRCNLNYLEKKCLDFIWKKYDKIDKTDEKWKGISTKLMLKIMKNKTS